MNKIKHEGKILEGVVISDKMKKTIVVAVTTKFRHPTYGRLMVKRRKYKAHDENQRAKVSDRVRIGECRPRSKEKRFELLEVLE
jgi:small subunit ribosomal protein S17